MKTVSLTLPASGDALPAFRASVAKWFAVAGQRSRLAGLTDEALADIGLDRDAVNREAARPFWDLPKGQR